MMFCIQCGNRLPDDAIFCNACGNSTKPTQPTTNPTQSSRITTQFDNNGQMIPPQLNSGPQAPIAQFGSAQFGGNPNNPQIAPTQFSSNPGNPQMPPMQQYGSNPGNPRYPPIQTGPHQFSSDQQMPPTQRATGQFGSSPNNQQLPPTQMASMPLSSNPDYPLYPPIQTGPHQYGSNPANQPFQSTPGGIRSPYESTQYSNDPLSQPWQVPLTPAAPAAPPPPPAGLQQWLARTVGPNLASNAVFGVSLGGVLAAIIGALAAIIIVSIAHAIAPHVLLYGGNTTGEDVVDYALGLNPLHSVFRDGLQLLLIMNGVGFHTQNNTDVFSSTSPLNGLLIIPAIVLTFGGYVAAGTDVQNRVQSSLWRGVSIAIPYTILLFFMTTQVNGCIPNGPGAICSTASSSNSQLTMDTTALLLFGVLWGALFGLLGASIKLARGQWRHKLYQYLRSNQRPQVVGAVTGSFVAVGIGIALSFLVVACFVAYTSYSSLLLSHSPSFVTGFVNGDWATLTLWTITWGPLYGANVFFFSMNAPVGLTSTNNSTTHVALSLFGTTPQISPWFHLLLVIPVICLFLGGRASAALGRVRDTGAGALQGALIAIPFTVLVMLLTPLSTITYSYVPGSTGSGNGFVDTAGVGAFDVFLWALLAGAVLGALGGMYQTSTMNATMSQIFKPLAGLITSLSKPGYALFARMSKQPNALQRTSTKDWLFSAVFCSLILLIGAAVVGGILLGLNQTLTLEQNQRIRDITSIILIAIPGLLVLSTCAAALRRDPMPVPVGSLQSGVSLPGSPLSGPQMPQYAQYPQQPPYPQQLQQPPYPQL